ncbi:MAG: excinuclease ABC subunit UvrA [Candidatus Bathyarchaeota archaeon]|nr:excinuclease ABC subunit UvrA [Candidatus Bathyarchaeota archaeon]
MTKFIRIEKAEQHNLKGFDIDIPRNRFVVITGPSGSGKSTLLFDTIFAEGQRRYVESLSTYARRFLGRLDRPKVEKITGIPPAIAIEQKGRTSNPRSTVGTTTEILDYLRLLYAHIGKPHCTKCGDHMEQLSAESAARIIMEANTHDRIIILAPIVKNEKESHQQKLDQLLKDGFTRVRVRNEVCEIEDLELDPTRSYNIDVVVDRLDANQQNQERLIGSLETAIETGKGVAIVQRKGKPDLIFAEQLMCPRCGITYEKLRPRAFSYNTPEGACSHCKGLGYTFEVDPDLIVVNKSRSLIENPFSDEAVRLVFSSHYLNNWPSPKLLALAEKGNIPVSQPWRILPEKAKELIMWGQPRVRIEYDVLDADGKSVKYHVKRVWLGIIPSLNETMKTSSSSWFKEHIVNDLSRHLSCPSCKGRKLRPESLAVTIGGKSIDQVTSLTIEDALNFFGQLELTEQEKKIVRLVLTEIVERLRFIISVGLDYLTLDRKSMTLSGGESQRIRLAAQIGSALTGVLYCLDEPSIGLHSRDIQRLIDTLQRIRSLGNTVIVVEHDRDTILAADHVIDMGPHAGVLGGKIIAEGSPKKVLLNHQSLTAQYLTGVKQIPIPANRRPGNGQSITVKGAKQHNLKNININIPLGKLVCVTGVSGSGKSTLVYETIYKALVKKLYNSKVTPGSHDAIEGLEHIEKVILVDQSPIGRTPLSNPATYTSVLTEIRKLFAQMPEAKTRGYTPSRFSFSTKAGRCEKCKGRGSIRIEMHFMSDVYIICDVCKGKRFDRETLEVTYVEKNIADVLNLSIDEALEFFNDIPSIGGKLHSLKEVGLGYLQLGQPATTLSGGEAQRMKLAKELAKRSTGSTIYILDEPTTGLAACDIDIMMQALNRLVDSGNTIIVVEHNLDVIKTADWIIDLGPEGGDRGGEIVATGTPETLCLAEVSYTAKYLKPVICPQNSQ